MSTKGISRG